MLPAPSSGRPHLDNEIVAPRDRIETQLIEIWTEVLGIDAIGIQDNFFDLGGNSLLAARLLVRIENAFCKGLPLAAIFQRPTVEQIAKILRNEDQHNAWSSLVPVQTGGFKIPFFCMAGVNALTALAHHLDPEQPVYGLAPLNLEDEQIYLRIEQMAIHYLQGIRALQPEGPYFLGGHSFGGLVAFEMANQLQMQGQKVGLLVLIDTYPSHIQKSINFYLHRLCYYLKRGQLVHVLGFLALRVEMLLVITPEDVLNQRYWASIREAIDDYKLRAYFGRIVFFSASEPRDPLGTLRDTRLDWANVAKGEMETYTIPGDHVTLLKEPNIRILAEKLRACLDEAASYRGNETCEG